MKILVVGGGSIGKRHIANLVAQGKSTVEVCDKDPQKLKNLTEKFNVPGFLDLSEALDRKPAAVLVCTPTSAHVSVALEAFSRGAHLFIEKPVAVSIEEALSLSEAAAQKRDQIIMVGCNMRFHPGVEFLKREMKLNSFGPLSVFYSYFSHYLPNWRPGTRIRDSYSSRKSEGGGIVLECIHEIDYLQYLAGSIIKVSAFTKNTKNLEKEGLETEDFAVLKIDFESGATAEVRLDYLRHIKMRGCDVIDPGRKFLSWFSKNKNPEQVSVSLQDGNRYQEIYRNDSYDPNEMYLKEMEHFYACIEKGGRPFVGPESATETLKWALEARDGARMIPEAKFN